jgi:apolipoprotein N-acyltransferase
VVLEGNRTWWNAVAGFTRAVGKPLVIGAVGMGRYPNGDEAPTNSAFLVDTRGKVLARWDKKVLVPPAETLLWLDSWPAVRRRVGDFLHKKLHFFPFLVPGSGTPVTTFYGGEERIGAMICYDDIVPGPASGLREAGADILLVLSNEAWFGKAEIGQHLENARFRAIENRLPLLRVTNTGATVAIDPAGRVTSSLPPGTSGVLLAKAYMTSLKPPPAWLPVVFRRAILALACCLVAWTFLTVRKHEE